MLRRLLMIASLWMPALLIAQQNPIEAPDWSNLMHDPNANFFEIQEAFNSYWEGKEITPGCGWKPFKRWEHRMSTRINPDGSLPTAEQQYRGYQDALEIRASRSEAGNWQQLGPILNQQTTREDIPGVGRTNTVAFHPTNPDIIFVGAPAGGLWRSYDGGLSWESNTDILPTLGVSAIAFDPFNPDIVYIGTGDRDANDAPGMGVMKSTDGGLTWEFSNDEIMASSTVGDIITDPTNPGVVLAATSNGVRRSTDYGETWTLSSNTQFYKQILFRPEDSNVVYATAQGRVYKSTNNGDSFSSVSNGLTICTRVVMAVTPADPDRIYVLGANSDDFKAMYLSIDDGENFEEMSDSPNILGWSASGDSDGGQAWYDLCMTADLENPDRIYVGGIRMKQSDDGGATWMDIQNNFLHVDQHWCEMSPHSNKLYLCNDGGFYTLEQPGEWVDLSKDMVIGQIYKFGQAPFSANNAISGYQDNGSMSFNGVMWDRVGGADGFECQYDPTDEDVFYTSIYYGQLYRTNGDVIGQKFAGNGELQINESGAWLSPWFVSDFDENTLFLGMKNVWRSRNIKTPNKQDIVWEKISSQLGGNDNSNLNQVVQHRADSNIVYCAEGSRRIFRTDNALAPVDEVTWIDHSNDLPWVQVPVTAIETHPTDSATVYIGFDNKVHKSINAGEEWVEVGTLPDSPVNSIVYDVQSNEGLYIATDMGIYYKDADMEDWISFSNGMPLGLSITELEIFYGETPDQNRLRASTYGRGLWESDLYGAETNAFPATAWLQTAGTTTEIYGPTPINSGFYKNLQNVTVTDFEMIDIEVLNGSVSDLSGGPEYTFLVTPDNLGEVEIVIPAEAATDENGLVTFGSDTLTLVYKEFPENFGIYGPGGVGDENDLTIWLRADEAAFIETGGANASVDGDKVQQWVDISGNGLIALQDTLDDRPTLRLGENGLNNRPAIEFNGENEFIIGRDIPSSRDISVFSVARADGPQWNDHGWLASARQDNGFIMHPWKESALFNATVIDENGDYHSTPQQWIVDAGAPQIYGMIYEYHPSLQVFQKVINGNRQDFNGQNHASREAGDLLSVRYGWDYDERFGAGQIAEHFIYGRRLFDSQRIIVANYLAARYTIDIGPNSRYDRPDMPWNVTGIGRVAEHDLHEDAQGKGVVRILSPSDLEDGEFLIWGHNEFPMIWEDTGYPLVSPHLDRTWAYEQTGDVGMVEVRIYDMSIAIEDEMGIVVSASENFLPGVMPDFYPLTDMGDYFSATVDFQDNGVFTVGTQPVVGVENISQVEAVLFPNPANEQLTVQLDGVSTEDLKVAVYDAVGRRVLTIQPQALRFSFGLESFESGMYMLVLEKANQRKTFQFVKQ